MYYLETTDLSIQQIADEVGFQDTITLVERLRNTLSIVLQNIVQQDCAKFTQVLLDKMKSFLVRQRQIGVIVLRQRFLSG
jgi:AraC-like DNA-binding protein